MELYHHPFIYTASWLDSLLCREATRTMYMCFSSGFTLISQQPYRTWVTGKECMAQYHSPSLLAMQLQGLVLNHAERETFIMHTYLNLGFILIS